MLNICYSGRSRPSALRLAEESSDINITRTSNGDVNWGRARANTQLNPDISNATNKRLMRELFREHDVPMPKLYTDHEAHALAKQGETILGRPDNHTKGRGFWLVRSNASFMRALRGTRKKRGATHFMEYIDAPREYRVHVFLDKSIRISEKAFFIDDNGKKAYTTAKPTHNVKHVRKAAKQAVKALGLDFGAVDILANDDECWVLEVNTAPGLGGSMPRVWVETFIKWKKGE